MGADTSTRERPRTWAQQNTGTVGAPGQDERLASQPVSIAALEALCAFSTALLSPVLNLDTELAQADSQ